MSLSFSSTTTYVRTNKFGGGHLPMVPCKKLTIKFHFFSFSSWKILTATMDLTGREESKSQKDIYKTKYLGILIYI